LEARFWDQHYASFRVMQPTLFAEFCAAHFIHPDDILVEVGCGNGRDAQYVAPHVQDYFGLDACPKAAELCRKAIAHLYDDGVVESRVLNTDASRFDFRTVAMPGKRTVVYSRFSVHSMNYDEEDRLLNALSMVDGPLLFLVEARTIFDKHYGEGAEVGRHEFVSDHYRRFIDPIEFISRFSRIGMPVFTSISGGQAKFGSEDPVVLRVAFDSELLAGRNQICVK
jgi:SAM-dependent methyltransferase